MQKRVLVAYASATGSTTEVAARVGETLATRGFAAEISTVAEVRSLEGYEAVVIGSAVHFGEWLPDALSFVRAHQATLLQIPTAVFCVHIQNTGKDDESRRKRLAYLDTVRSLIRPVSEGFFAGRFNRAGARKMLPPLVAAFVPTLDFRNWRQVREWVEALNLAAGPLEVGTT